MSALDIYQTNQKFAKLPRTPWGQLPVALRLLLICGPNFSASWLGSILRSDGTVAIDVVQVDTLVEGLTSLRNDTFDAVLMTEDCEIDMSEMVAGVQGANSQMLPILLLGQRPGVDQQAVAFENGLDGYVCLASASIRSLVWMISRAVERTKLLNENSRLWVKHNQQKRRCKDGIQVQIAELGDLIHRQANVKGNLSEFFASLKARLGNDVLDGYRDLLKTYVIMSTGTVVNEVKDFCHIFQQVALEPVEVVALHRLVLEEILDQLGVKSLRHVMDRANLLLVQLLICFCQPADAPNQPFSPETGQGGGRFVLNKTS